MLNIFQKEEVEPNKQIKSDSQLDTQDIQPQVKSIPPKLLFPKPKILLIDLNDESERILKSAGYKIDVGFFGASYNTEKSDDYEVVTPDFSLPNYSEQEIIVIDLSFEKPHVNSLIGNQETVIGNNYYWVKKNFGIVNTKPSKMFTFQKSFDNILRHSGVFIIFADSRTSLETVYATQSIRGFSPISSNIDNWSFLSVFGKSIFNADYVEGTEIFAVKDDDSNFGRFIERSIKNAKYTCTLESLRGHSVNRRYFENYYYKSWVSIANDKYGNSVAGAFLPNKYFKGSVFVFPQIENKSLFLLEFLRDILPEFNRELFPYSDNKNWIERNEYQPISVRNLNRQIEQIEVEAKQKIEKINENIQLEKEKVEYQNILLTDDGDSLVKAVEQTFKVLGFKNVVNVDEEYEKQGKTNSNDEDLWIRDKPTSLLVEIKGVAGHPKDDDVFQITKHVPIRMKEWKEFDVKALSIINHQKAIPALDREIKPFRQLILDSATEQLLGLMTTFDLYRLVRSFLKNGWKHEDIKDLFIQSGHISIVPVHYEYVGIIENYWEKVGAVGIRVAENAIKLDDTISFELPIEFEEMNVDSLQVENVSVKIAEPSMLAGIKTNLSKEILKKGTRVFRVITLKS